MADTRQVESQQPLRSPSGFNVIWREIVRDKIALVSLIFMILLCIFVYGTSLILDEKEILRVDLFSIHQPPSEDFLLGTDYGGRDVFGQLIIGARNSVTIGLMVTLIGGFIGITFGIVSGYFGEKIDNVLMRIVDFFIVLPTLMLIIVFVTIVPKYSVWAFILILSLFQWMGPARLIRSKALQERELEYIQASKTSGSSHFKIIFTQLLPNVSSLIIVSMTLKLAANIGIETGLTFLGFGLPESTPSLGTLISYSTNPHTLEHRWWIWLPASLLILVMMLSINNVGQALKRATDAKQRRG